MRNLIAATVLCVSPLLAQANCYGDDSYKTCYDYRSGNRYTVESYGNTTTVRGYNSNTGNSWSQTSDTYGDTTYHRGRASNGNTWSGSSTNYGSHTYHRGIDSRGNPYSGTTWNDD